MGHLRVQSVVTVVGAIGIVGLMWAASMYMNTKGSRTFETVLSGREEVPAILTPGTGSFRATLNADGTALDFELTYENLVGPATVAHLHFAQFGVNGPIFAFLCGGDGMPDCPAGGGTVTGTITAANIRGIPEQGLADGDFQGAITIMREGLAYVNVHSTTFPPGEIRGQL